MCRYLPLKTVTTVTTVTLCSFSPKIIWNLVTWNDMSSFFISIAPWRLKIQSSLKQHALKGQKLLAQGIALGIMSISKAPCKGKSFVYYPGILKLLPLQGERFVAVITQGDALGGHWKRYPILSCIACFWTLILVQEAFHLLKVEYFFGQEYSPK